MNAGAAGPWGRLLPLAAVVLAVHLLLLAPTAQRLAPQREPRLPFLTRSLAPAPAPVTPPVDYAAPRPPAPPSEPATPRPALPVAAAKPASARPADGVAAGATTPAPPVATQATAASVSAAAALPAVHAPPAPARLHYELTVQSRAFTARGEAVLDWRHDGQAYEARLALSAPGYPARVQRSTGRITPQGLAPGYFADRFRGEQATHFDHAGGRVVFSSNRPQAPLVDGLQDRLSAVVQLSMLLAGAPGRFTPGTEIVLPTAGTREAEDWTFRVEGPEDLELPGGVVHAWKLQRLPRRAYDQQVELWFAPGMDYAPVRLRLTHPDGGVVEQRWSSTDRG